MKPLSLLIPLSLALSVHAAQAQKPKPAPPATPESVTELTGITFARYGDREIQLDLYHPKQGEGPFPGIVLVHGGGWTGGARQAFRTTGLMLAERGYVVANIDYRLATEEKFPGAVNDVKAAVRWLRAHAEEYHVIPDRIAGIGGSAGGHLIGMVALTGHSRKFEGDGGWPDQSSELQAAILMGAGVDQVTRVKESKSGSIKNCVIFFGGEYDEVPEVYAQGSPITHLDQHSPPLLFLDGELDNPGQRYVEMRRQMDDLGIPNELEVIPGARHGAWGREPWLTPFVEAMDAYLKKQFGK